MQKNKFKLPPDLARHQNSIIARSDGVVVAADSMLTSSMGQLPIAHHTGRKVSIQAGGQIFAYAGDQGLGARFGFMADSSHGSIASAQHPVEYPLFLTRTMVAQFQGTGIVNVSATGIVNPVNLNTVLAFQHSAGHQCCVFETLIQPRLLDGDHFYVAIGSGKLAADPFLRFLVDIFCQNGQPNVREAVFLAAWTVEDVIHTNPGGVAGPVRVAVLERNRNGNFVAREVPDTEIEEHSQAMESAAQALRSWHDGIQSGTAAVDVPAPPEIQADATGA